MKNLSVHAQPRIKLNNYPFLGLQFMYRGNNNTKSAALNEAFNGPLNFYDLFIHTIKPHSNSQSCNDM